MARVPDYNQRQVQLAGFATQGFSTRGPDTSGLASGLAQVEGGAMDMMSKAREEAETTQTKEAANLLDQYELDLRFNPETGLYTRKGKNAQDITNQGLAALDKKYEEISAGIKNERVRKRFADYRSVIRERFSKEFNRYEFEQNEVYKDQVDDGLLETTMQGAALYYNNPNKVAELQAKALGLVRSKAQRKGFADEQLQSELLKTNSSMLTGVIQRLASDDPYKARQYFQSQQGGMTADDQVRVGGMIEAKIDRLQQQAEMARLRAEARAERALGKINTQIASGIPATDEMWSAWARQVQGTPAQAEFNKLRRQENETQQVLRLPIDQQIAYVNQRSADLQNNGGTVAEASNLARLGRAVEANGKMMADAPLDYYQQRLGGDVQPLDFNSDSLPAALSERVAAIQGMRQKFGPTVAMKPLLPQEAKQLSAQLEQMSPDQQSQLFATLHSAMGDDRAYAGAMQQIAPDSPVRALAGMIAGKQRSMTVDTYPVRRWIPDEVVTSGDVAKTMALGESILNKSKAGKAQDGRSSFPLPKDTDFDTKLASELGTVFAGQPQSYGLAAQAVRSYYTGQAAQLGDITGVVNGDRLKAAIKATVGDVVEFNGAKTIAPWGMPGDTFEQVARQRLTDMLRAQGASERDLAAASALTLRQAKDGVYYVMQGQQYKYGADGKPLMINLNEGAK